MADIPAELRDAAQKYLESLEKKNNPDPSYTKRKQDEEAFGSATEELLKKLSNWLVGQKP